MAVTNNPFNNLVFNEVRPTYVGPPVEEIANTREYLTELGRVNRDAYTLLDSTYANMQSDIGPDPTGAAMIDEHRAKLKNNISDMLERKDYAYMGPELSEAARRFAGDPRLINRKKAYAKWKEDYDNIYSNANIPERFKKSYVGDYQYRGDDESGTLQYSNVYTPPESVDMEKIYLPALNQAVADATGSEDYYFLDAQGNRTKDITQAATPGVYYVGDQKKYLSKTRIKDILAGSLEANPEAESFLVHDYVSRSEEYQDATPEERQQIVNTILADKDFVRDLADIEMDRLSSGYAYLQKSHTERFDYISGLIKDDSNDTSIDSSIGENVTFATSNNLENKQSVADEKKKIKDSTEGLYNSLAYGYEDEEDAKQTIKSILEDEELQQLALNGSRLQFYDEFNARMIKALGTKPGSGDQNPVGVNRARQIADQLRSNAFKDRMLDHVKRDRLEDLREEDPTTFGYLDLDDTEIARKAESLANKIGLSLEDIPGDTKASKLERLLKRPEFYKTSTSNFNKMSLTPSSSGGGIGNTLPQGDTRDPKKEYSEDMSELSDYLRIHKRRAERKLEQQYEDKQQNVSSVITTTKLPLSSIESGEALKNMLFTPGTISRSNKVFNVNTGDVIGKEHLLSLLGWDGDGFKNLVEPLDKDNDLIQITTVPVDEGGENELAFVYNAKVSDGEDGSTTITFGIPASSMNIPQLNALESHPIVKSIKDYRQMEHYNVDNVTGIDEEGRDPMPGYPGLSKQGDNYYYYGSSISKEGFIDKMIEINQDMAEQDLKYMKETREIGE